MNAKGDANRSVRNTKRRLSEALLQLLTQKPARDITVRELTELAKVSRGTFYFHYSDIYDLLRQMEDDQLEALQAVASGLINGMDNDEPPQTLRALFDYLASNENLTRALLGPNGDPLLVERLKQVIEEKCVGALAREEEGGSEKTHEYLAGFAVSGCLGVVEKWLQSGCAEPPEKMARLTWQAIRAINVLGRTADCEKL
ncbi:MAG: TetR/AcrR family transcriptional regulator [Gemmiger sp.]